MYDAITGGFYHFADIRRLIKSRSDPVWESLAQLDKHAHISCAMISNPDLILGNKITFYQHRSRPLPLIEAAIIESHFKALKVSADDKKHGLAHHKQHSVHAVHQCYAVCGMIRSSSLQSHKQFSQL